MTNQATDMTDKTRQDSGSTHIIRYALELGLLWIDGDGRNKVREALAALDALEAKLASIGAGGVRALSAAPAEQQAMESVLVDGAASQPPISNTLWRMLTGGYEHTYILQLPNDSRDRRELIDRACRNWRRICAEIDNSAAASAVSPQTAQAPQQAAPKAAPGDEGKALAALRYYMNECSGAEPSISVFHRMVEEALGAAPQQEAQEPVATVIKKGADRQWMSERLGALPDGIYSLYLAPQPAPAPLSEQDERRAFEQDFMRVLPGENLKRKFGHYEDPRTRHRWDGWKARAALAAQEKKQ